MCSTWALYGYEVIPDLDWLASLAGKKIILRGNHDLWWRSTKKINELLENYPNISHIHNNSIEIEGISICGTRGWDIIIKDKHDEKILKREAIRLQESLEKAPSSEKIAFFHYPPILKNCSTDIFEKILQEYGVKQVYFGHLHGDNIKNAIQGKHNGIYYKCIACDQIDFTPIPLILN